MRRFRVLLSLLLGLSLMTQGMAVAVAAAGPAPMQMTSSMDSMDMSADGHDMPCMDMPDHSMPEKCPAKCCDGKVCLDMTSCAQAQPAISAYRLSMVYASVEHDAPMSPALTVAESPPTSLLRPPITFHA